MPDFSKLENFLARGPWTLTCLLQDKAHLANEVRSRRKHWEVRSSNPRVSVLMALYNSNPEHLDMAIASVSNQSYPNVELVLVDDASPKKDHLKVVQKALSKTNSGCLVRFAQREENGGISEARNTAATLATGDYVCIVDHDDVIHPLAIDIMMETMFNQQANFLYSFECKLTEDGQGFTQFLSKPKFSRFNLLHYNYICHLTVVHRDLLKDLESRDGVLFRKEFDGAEDHDLFLRLSELKGFRSGVVPFFLYYWRITDNSTAKDTENKPAAQGRGRSATLEALARTSKTSSSDLSFISKTGRELFAHRSHHALWAELSETQDLRRKIRLIFWGSKAPNWVSRLSWSGQKGVEISKTGFVKSRYDHETDYREIHAQLENIEPDQIIVLAHGDVRPSTPHSLLQLMSWFETFDDVGTVSASLLDSRIFPKPDAVGPDAIHAFGGYMFKPKLGFGGFPRLETRGEKSQFTFEAHETFANAIHLMAFKASTYFEVVGFRKDLFPRRLADLDFCLRLRDRGWRHFNIGSGLFHGRNLWQNPFGNDALEESILITDVCRFYEYSIFQLGYDYAFKSLYGP